MSSLTHTPVLLKEIIDFFAPQPGDRLLDATLGLGGHAKAFLAAAPDTSVVGLDVDPRALVQAKENLQEFGDRVTYINQNFGDLKDSVTGGGILEPPLFSHILFDLGIGSHQLDDPGRGFSFGSRASLLMRFGASETLPPSRLPSINYLEKRLGHLPDVPELLAHLKADELADVIYTYGDERYSRRIAAAIKKQPWPATATELAERITAAVPARYEHGRIHPATRTFQALRLAVNRELEVLAVALPQTVELLAHGGKLAVISFHSGEDRIAKQFFRSQKGTLTLLTKKPWRVGPQEIAVNPRARSAKVRVAKRE